MTNILHSLFKFHENVNNYPYAINGIEDALIDYGAEKGSYRSEPSWIHVVHHA